MSARESRRSNNEVQPAASPNHIRQNNRRDPPITLDEAFQEKYTENAGRLLEAIAETYEEEIIDWQRCDFGLRITVKNSILNIAIQARTTAKRLVALFASLGAIATIAPSIWEMINTFLQNIIANI